MKLALAKEMRSIDKEASFTYGLPEIVLMENAGRSIAQALTQMLGSPSGKNIVVAAGSGNNGGDAFVAARYLLNAKAKVKIFLSGDRARFSQSTDTMYHVLAHMGAEIFSLACEADYERLMMALGAADAVVDGILGTGYQGALREDKKKLIETINLAHKPVLAIDVPSGVETDSSSVPTAAIKATQTVALGLYKPCHFLAPGRDFAGRCIVSDIGIPHALLTSEELKLSLLDNSLASPLLLKRDSAAHKGSCGRILVVAGSIGMSGAAALSSLSALRVGAGVVTLATPKSIAPILAGKLTEVMVQAIDDAGKGFFGGKTALAQVMALASKCDALLLGPGLGRDEATQEFLLKLCPNINCQLILDADALFALREYLPQLMHYRVPPILTPHLGELATLLGVDVAHLRRHLLEMVTDTATRYKCILVAKSECTLVALPDGRVFFNSVGNSAMATAGSGDVLAGTIAGLSKQTTKDTSALLGVYLHSLAGDIAAGKYGRGLIAGDIVSALPQALIKLAKERP